jgi:capsular exopolysaccharide synthesis family protein
MGKVYDALRRAEEQRTQRTGRAARHRHRYTEDGGTFNKRRIALLQPGSFAAEQFRTLRARIDSLAADRPLRTIAVTSALAGEGKTLAAVNLAIVSSMSVDRRVLLVDCDLRKPKIHASLGLRPEAGLAEVLKGEAPLDKAILRVEGVNLDVLPARNQPTNPSELLASEAMQKLVEELVARYHRVVFDTPAALALPDAKAVSELSDGVVLVVRAETSPQEDVQAALDVLDRRRVIGLVLNGAAVDPERYGY